MPSSRRSRWPLLLLLLALLGGVGVWYGFFRDSGDPTQEMALWTVDRRPLRISILETGSIEALDSFTVVSEVEGQAAILSIVPEGTIVTDADVTAGLTLVELDSSEITDRLERQKIEFAAAESAYQNAVNNLEIQRQQNASDVRRAELNVRFAELDLERYVGKALTQRLRQISADELAATLAARSGTDGESGQPAAPSGLRREFLTLLENESLEGEALQKIRQLDSDIKLADEELKRAQVKLDWTEKLFEKGYVSRDEREADRIALGRRDIEMDRGRTARDQYVQYDFPKEVERLLSDLLETRDQLDRTIKQARSAEARVLADVQSREEQRQLQAERLKKYEVQVLACVIRATRPGLVVYASSGGGRRGRDGDRIQEGTVVRERQQIIRIPNLSSLGIKVSIHESVVEGVRVDQDVTAVVDALAGQPLRGKVERVALLPDSTDSWLNPDLKVYPTLIRLTEPPATLRPGMSAQVEIFVADLEGVLAIPVQAVAGTPESPVAWVVEGSETVERPIRLGLSNDRYVAILEGLAPGDRVMLAPPRPNRLTMRPSRDGEDARRDPGTAGAAPPNGTAPAPSDDAPAGGAAAEGSGAEARPPTPPGAARSGRGGRAPRR